MQRLTFATMTKRQHLATDRKIRRLFDRGTNVDIIAAKLRLQSLEVANSLVRTGLSVRMGLSV